jgi:hypothetical protein
MSLACQGRRRWQHFDAVVAGSDLCCGLPQGLPDGTDRRRVAGGAAGDGEDGALQLSLLGRPGGQGGRAGREQGRQERHGAS